MCVRIFIHFSKGATIRYPGGGARKNFEINKFLLENGEINKFLLNNGEKNISILAPCIYSITENPTENIFAPLRHEIIFCHQTFLAHPPPQISNGRPLSVRSPISG